MPEALATRIVIVDPTEIARVGIARSLEDLGFIVAAAIPAARWDKRAERFDIADADVFLIDLSAERCDDLIADVSARGRIAIAIGLGGESEQPFGALTAGASGFLTKDLPARAWADAIRAAMRGEAPLSRAMTAKLITMYRTRSQGAALAQLIPSNARLTDREWAVLAHVSEGKTNREVAAELCVSVETVRTHVSNILAKLGTRNRSQAAIVYHSLVQAG